MYARNHTICGESGAMPHATYVCLATSSAVLRCRFVGTHADGGIPCLQSVCSQLTSHLQRMTGFRPPCQILQTRTPGRPCPLRADSGPAPHLVPPSGTRSSGLCRLSILHSSGDVSCCDAERKSCRSPQAHYPNMAHGQQCGRGRSGRTRFCLK